MSWLLSTYTVSVQYVIQEPLICRWFEYEFFSYTWSNRARSPQVFLGLTSEAVWMVSNRRGGGSKLAGSPENVKFKQEQMGLFI